MPRRSQPRTIGRQLAPLSASAEPSSLRGRSSQPRKSSSLTRSAPLPSTAAYRAPTHTTSHARTTSPTRDWERTLRKFDSTTAVTDSRRAPTRYMSHSADSAGANVNFADLLAETLSNEAASAHRRRDQHVQGYSAIREKVRGGRWGG